MNLSSKIAQLRRQMGWSQDELAQKLDVSRQAVYKWENGQSRPDTDKLLVLAKLFNVSVDNLLDDESEIVHRQEPAKKLDYGSITVKSLPNGLHGSEIYYALSEEDQITFDAKTTLLKIPVIKSIILSQLMKSLKSDMEHVPFMSKKAEYETQMEKKGFKFIQITPYLLEWLFVDRENGVFGFFFDGEEQFICPVQNFIDITGDGYAYTLKCYDECGELAKYEIALNTMAKFLIDAQNASALKREGRLYDDRLLPRPAANPTIISKSFDDLKDLIEFERSRLA